MANKKHNAPLSTGKNNNNNLFVNALQRSRPYHPYNHAVIISVCLYFDHNQSICCSHTASTPWNRNAALTQRATCKVHDISSYIQMGRNVFDQKLHLVQFKNTHELLLRGATWYRIGPKTIQWIALWNRKSCMMLCFYTVMPASRVWVACVCQCPSPLP